MFLPVLASKSIKGKKVKVKFTLEQATKAQRGSRGIARAERDGTRAEIRFRLSSKRTSPFKSVGASVQSTAGSREVCASALVMLDIPR